MDEKECSVLNLIPQKNDAVLAYRIFDEQAVVVDLVHGTLNMLNATATRIWQLIEKNMPAKKIAETITEEFEVSLHEAIDDVTETLRNMTSMGWVKNLPYSKACAVSENNKNGEIFEALREQAMLKRIPLVVHFDLTYRCPLRCVHCYLTGGKKRLECTTDEIKDILDQLVDAGSLYLTLSGGEIFLRDDLPEIVAYARSLHFAIRLLTSGELINIERVKEIVDWRPEMVAFSVYDLDASIHDAITRKRGSLAKTMDVIHVLKKEGVPLKISSVLMDRNVNGYGRVYSFAKELGAQFQADYRITPKTDGSQEPLRFHITDQEVMRVLSDPIFSREYESDPTQGYSGVFNSIPCGAGHMSCYISPYGMVTPCVQAPIECGNLREQTFLEIWTSSPALESFRAIRFADIPKCAGCELFAHCRPCPGLNLVETGSITTPPQRVCKEAEYMKILNKQRR
ncbi:MAG: radical SAM protein [Parcubacteria group bacterium Athens0714_24]|nr:MAG: radical SAM protein [Parcubacteria group bacterium Athens0714_24]